MKRLLDVSLAVTFIICLSPLFLVVAILVKWKIGSPIIFKQERAGLGGKVFFLYKFRTMLHKVDSSNQLLPDYMRIKPLGHILRKYSLDELPQLINVLKGDLSLVGPRPLLIEYLPLYSKEQAKRHLVKPGITGWAQINGRNSISWEEKFNLDVWYVNNRSFFLDLKILFLTFMKVIKTEGINQGENITMEAFKGNESSIREGHG
ncbi:MAG: sugar transferase [Heyndrickxia sp.]